MIELASSEPSPIESQPLSADITPSAKDSDTSGNLPQEAIEDTRVEVGRSKALRFHSKGLNDP